jgi:hydroxyacylglutathione hydrolase
MDSKLTLVTEQTGDGFYVAQFKTSELAIFSYYVESNKESLLLDPVFDVKTYTEFITKRHSHLKYVALTHYHADYLSGHTEFKAPIVMGASSARSVNGFKIKECKDGEAIHIGGVTISVLHTPGHTLESSCFLLKDHHGKDAALFTGDTVFLGEVGRPDLACSEKITSQDLASMLYDSIQRLKTLDGNIRIYPGHGSGSACGKSIGAGNFCTLGAQNTNNYGFKFTDKDEFVKALTANIPKPPKYFFFDAGLNQKGADSYHNAHTHANRPLTHEQFLKHKNATIIDTRMDVGPGNN